MATYGSYKKIVASQILDNSIPDSAFADGAGPKYNVKWIRGPIGGTTSGCCCYWTVPTGVKRVTFDVWGAGGNGHGFCSWDRCHHYFGAGGGYYSTKTIAVQEGWNYTICAGGTYPCCSYECTGCRGCASYVNGCNLSNFCAWGGNRGCANTSWAEMCFSDWNCCVSPTFNGSDFAMGNMRPAGTGPYNCHCYRHTWCAGNAPFLAAGTHGGHLAECWKRCACWTVPYASGGPGGMTTYCGNWDNGTGGIGGSGVIKITYV
tara:strand:- start:17901 stop:18683 length:783 start_codon:yes stop_codon:yes gene_type:complete